LPLAVAPPAVGADKPEPATAKQSDAKDDYERKVRPGEWEMLFDEGISADEYARQLDFFGIELAAVGKDGKIQYAARLSERKPERSLGTKETEKRTSIGWKRGTLSGVDRKLLAKAGIHTEGKQLLHYYPLTAERQLVRIEYEFAKVPLDDIKRTRFGIRAVEEKVPGEPAKPATAAKKKRGAAKEDPPKAYEFYVIEQDTFGDDEAREKPGKGPAKREQTARRKK
jgi:hypothetical protein